MIARGVPLRYEKQFDRWVVEVEDQRFGLHCGEGFELHLEDTVIPCRIELGNRWYVITTSASFGLMEGCQYTITINI